MSDSRTESSSFGRRGFGSGRSEGSDDRTQESSRGSGASQRNSRRIVPSAQPGRTGQGSRDSFENYETDGNDLGGDVETGATGAYQERESHSASARRGGRDALFGQIIDDDNRRVSDTSQFPFNAICRLDITFPDTPNRVDGGTGWLAGPRLVVTAGHCVFQHGQGGWADNIRLRTTDGRTIVCRRFRAIKAWTQSADGNPDFDFGAILLDEDETDFFGFGTRTDTELLGSKVHVAGYPAAGSRTQVFHEDKIVDLTDRRVMYLTDTVGGQSGAPVWVKSGNDRIAVAIHTDADRPGGRGHVANEGRRIDDELRNKLVEWKEESQA